MIYHVFNLKFQGILYNLEEIIQTRINWIKKEIADACATPIAPKLVTIK